MPNPRPPHRPFTDNQIPWFHAKSPSPPPPLYRQPNTTASCQVPVPPTAPLQTTKYHGFMPSPRPPHRPFTDNQIPWFHAKSPSPPPPLYRQPNTMVSCRVPVPPTAPLQTTKYHGFMPNSRAPPPPIYRQPNTMVSCQPPVPPSGPLQTTKYHGFMPTPRPPHRHFIDNQRPWFHANPPPPLHRQLQTTKYHDKIFLLAPLAQMEIMVPVIRALSPDLSPVFGGSSDPPPPPLSRLHRVLSAKTFRIHTAINFTCVGVCVCATPLPIACRIHMSRPADLSSQKM